MNGTVEYPVQSETIWGAVFSSLPLTGLVLDVHCCTFSVIDSFCRAGLGQKCICVYISFCMIIIIIEKGFNQVQLLLG